ncbi:hypothetical protein H7I76_04485 [Mycolicibacterium vaccae]|nr:hypothetical protein [Mycolicibacterium vaccae]
MYAFFVKAFGGDIRERPPRHFLELAYEYAPSAILYFSYLDPKTKTWGLYWLTDTGLGVITCQGGGDDAEMSGDYRPLARIKSVKLQAVVEDKGFRAIASPKVRVQFDAGDDVELPPPGYYSPEPEEFIAALLSRL